MLKLVPFVSSTESPTVESDSRHGPLKPEQFRHFRIFDRFIVTTILLPNAYRMFSIAVGIGSQCAEIGFAC